MSVWLHNLPIVWMGLLVFVCTYILTGGSMPPLWGQQWTVVGAHSSPFLPASCHRSESCSLFLSRSPPHKYGTTTTGHRQRSITRQARSKQLLFCRRASPATPKHGFAI